MHLDEQKFCNLLPQLGKTPKMESKVGDGKSKKGRLSHITGKKKEHSRKLQVVAETKCHDKSGKKNCRWKKKSRKSQYFYRNN